MSYRPRSLAPSAGPHNRLVVLTGVSCSGKDFLLSRMLHENLLPPSVAIYNFGESLYALLRLSHPELPGRDAIRHLIPPEEVDQAMQQIVEEILAAQPAVLNTHVVYRHEQSFIFRLDSHQDMNPYAYVYVWADPEDILRWRSHDSGRLRDAESLTDISFSQDIYLELCSIAARRVGARMMTMWNRPNNVLDNINIIREIMDEIS